MLRSELFASFSALWRGLLLRPTRPASSVGGTVPSGFLGSGGSLGFPPTGSVYYRSAGDGAAPLYVILVVRYSVWAPVTLLQ